MITIFTAIGCPPFSWMAGAGSKATTAPKFGGVSQSSDRKENRLGRPGLAIKSGRRLTTFPILRVVCVNSVSKRKTPRKPGWVAVAFCVNQSVRVLRPNEPSKNKETKAFDRFTHSARRLSDLLGKLRPESEALALSKNGWDNWGEGGNSSQSPTFMAKISANLLKLRCPPMSQPTVPGFSDGEYPSPRGDLACKLLIIIQQLFSLFSRRRTCGKPSFGPGPWLRQFP